MSMKVSKCSPELKIGIKILFGANKMPVFPERSIHKEHVISLI